MKRPATSDLALVAALLASLLLAPGLFARQSSPEPPPPPDKSREGENRDDQVKKQIEDLEQALEEYEKELKTVKAQAEASRPGTTNFLLTGYGFGAFADRQHENSSFSAGFNPILLWKLSNRVFAEAEVEVELEEREAEFDLEYVHLTYLLNDRVTLGAGKFLAPFGTFNERLHPPWINKLPDAPLAFTHDGLAPPTVLGFQARGGTALGSMRLNYVLYVSNGPRLNTGEEEPEEVGMLHFDNNLDIDNNKAYGAHVGLLPIPALEVGYSFQRARVAASETSSPRVGALLQAADLTFIRDIDALNGALDARVEWVWSKVDTTTYDPDRKHGFGPLRFNNARRGGYAQLAYRPSKASKLVKNFEIVGRYDALDNPKGLPEGMDVKRWTYGLNYWFGPSTVLKIGYQTRRDEEAEGETKRTSGFLVQAAIGF